MTGITTRSLQSGTLLSANELPMMITREELSSTTAYYDSASPSNPTIGIGVNLNNSANLALVLQDLNVPASALSTFQSAMASSYVANGASTSALNSALNATLANYAGAATSFALTADQVQSLFATVAQNAITGLNQVLASPKRFSFVSTMARFRRSDGLVGFMASARSMHCRASSWRLKDSNVRAR